MTKQSISKQQNSPTIQKNFNERGSNKKPVLKSTGTRFSRLLLAKKRLPSAKAKSFSTRLLLKTPINTSTKNSSLTQDLDPLGKEDIKLELSSGLQNNSSNATHNLEENIGIISQGNGDSFSQRELRALIRKISLSFKVKADEANFLIKDGLFEGAHFGIKRNGQDLSIEVGNASEFAEQILNDHVDQLRTTLSNHEIKLADVRFMS